MNEWIRKRLEARSLWPASLAPHLSPGLGPQGSATVGGGKPAPWLQASSRDSISGTKNRTLNTYSFQSGYLVNSQGGACWHLTITGRGQGCGTKTGAQVSQLLGIAWSSRGNMARSNFLSSGVSRPLGRAESEKPERLLPGTTEIIWSDQPVLYR